MLTNLATSQLRAGYVQCDLHRRVAVGLPAPKVFFSPFPLARTSVVVAAKSWFVLGGRTREERLQRYLNEELAALYGAPWDFCDQDSRDDIKVCTADHVAVGETAGLRVMRKKKPQLWDAPYLVRSDQADNDRPPAENELVQAIFAASGFGDGEARRPYTLLSAAVHGRFSYAGVSAHTPTGPSLNGVTMKAMHTPVDVTAKVTALAAFTTRTHLRVLARYMNVGEDLVQERLQDSLEKWCAIGGITLPE